MQRVGSNAFNCRRSAEKALARNVVGGGLALASVLFGCAWIILRPNLTADFVDSGADIVATGSVAPVARVAAAQPTAPAAQLAAVQPAAPIATVAAPQPTPADPIIATQSTALTPGDPETSVALLDPAHSFGPRPGALSASPPGKLDYRFAAPAARPAAAQIAAAFAAQTAAPVAAAVATPVVQETPQPTPAPVRRPVQSASLGPPSRSEVRTPQSPTPPAEQKVRDNKALPSAAADKPKTVFEKLFGKPEQPSIALAYAPSDGGVLGDGESIAPNLSPPYDRWTAVYDISAATVYMPDGTKLEAHSGLGPMKDDPRNTHMRMRGATPAHVYDIRPREALFHGVAALRLLPVGGEKAIFGRNGILAHTYMLGPRGDSNGCVSFKDYNAFLRAYRNGEVKRLAVVARVE